MSKNPNTNQINEKVKPFIEKYLDNKYKNTKLKKMPDVEEIKEIAVDIKDQLLTKYPELEGLLNEGSKDDINVAFYGCCGYLLWGLLLGSLYCRCGRRNCRCGRGCRPRC